MILIESIFVGVWTCLLYILLKSYWNSFALWFLLGFCKHGLAGILGLHDYYCRLKGGTQSNHKTLFLESLCEGGLFAFAYFFIPDHWLSVFLLGFTLHLFFEVIGVHTYFVKTACKK